MATARCLRTSQQTVSNFGILARTASVAPAVFAEMMLLVVRSAFLASLLILVHTFFTAINSGFGGWVCRPI